MFKTTTKQEVKMAKSSLKRMKKTLKSLKDIDRYREEIKRYQYLLGKVYTKLENMGFTIDEIDTRDAEEDWYSRPQDNITDMIDTCETTVKKCQLKYDSLKWDWLEKNLGR